MRRRPDIRGLARSATGRVRGSGWAIAQASLAAATAWWFAHRVLGHAQPFFAPIAAAIAMSTTRIQRSRRIVQMVGGVLLGIAIGELLTSAFGTSAVSIGVIVFITLTATLLAGAGFIGEGMMFSNQAAASAVLVATLHRHGTGAERAVDVLVGGSAALLVGVGLFPAQPLVLLVDSERSLLRVLAETLATIDHRVSGEREEDEAWALAAGRRIHNALGLLARSRATAHINVRVAPRRWRLRAAVDAEIKRTTTLDLLASAVLGLVRGTAGHAADPVTLPPGLRDQLHIVSTALRRVADAPRPWTDKIQIELSRSDENPDRGSRKRPAGTSGGANHCVICDWQGFRKGN